jgi:XapX domain-containing protein
MADAQRPGAERAGNENMTPPKWSYDMKIYLFSLGAGILVGVIYSLLDVRSPAPPVVALLGLLGILVGEQAVPLAKRLWSGNSVSSAWLNDQCVPHVFGELPVAKFRKEASMAPNQERWN